jgi:WD40 repeat protein
VGEIRWSTDDSMVFISMRALTDTNTGKSPSPALEHAAIDVFSLQNYQLHHDYSLTCEEKPNRSQVQFDVASDKVYVAYSCGQGTSVYIWDLNQRKLSYTYKGHKHPVTYLAWSPDSCYIASAEEREVQVWQALDSASCG